MYNVVPIFVELRSPSRIAMRRVATRSVGSIAFGYAAVSTLGYVQLQGNVTGDVMTSFCGSSSIFVRVLSMLIGVGIVVSTPLSTYEVVQLAERIGLVPETPHENIFLGYSTMAVMAVVLGLAALLAVLEANLGQVVSLVGAVFGIPLMFVLPLSFRLVLLRDWDFKPTDVEETLAKAESAITLTETSPSIKEQEHLRVVKPMNLQQDNEGLWGKCFGPEPVAQEEPSLESFDSFTPTPLFGPKREGGPVKWEAAAAAFQDDKHISDEPEPEVDSGEPPNESLLWSGLVFFTVMCIACTVQSVRAMV